MIFYEDKVKSLFVDDFPRTLLLVGECGCGKHSLVDIISKKFLMGVEDITDSISVELIDDITLRVEPKIYLIDCDSISVGKENVILKFLEEPLKNSYIILLASSRQNVIDTIYNRCQVWSFGEYDIEFLKGFVGVGYSDADLLLTYATTPGQVIEYQKYPIKEMSDFAEKIILNVGKANIQNALTVSDKIAFKDEKDKYNFVVFIKILEKVCLKEYRDGKCSFSTYKLVNELYRNSIVSRYNKKFIFDKFLIELKMESVRNDDTN